MINRTMQIGLLTAGLIGGLATFAAAQSRDPVTELKEARRVYVPIEDLNVVAERDKQGVLLTKTKFDELLASARSNLEKNPIPDGRPVVLASADYAAQIVGDQLVIAVTAELSQFANDWTETRFALQRLAIEQASLDGAPAMIGRHSDGTVSLFSSGRGKHVLKMQFSTELNAVGSDQVSAFSLLRAPTGTMALTLPAGKRLLIGNLQLERPQPLDQQAEYRFAVGGTSGVQLRITDRASENSADSLMFASTGYGLHVAPGEVTWHALTTLQVFGKPVDRLTFSVPKSLQIADVEATGLEGWTLADDANNPARTMISLVFGQAFDASRKVAFKGVMATETGKAWTVPTLQISNVTSHVGQIVVQHPAGVRLRVEEATGVRRATNEQKPAADMPDDLAKLAASEFLRYDVWNADFSLKITTQPKQREVQSAIAAVLDVNATGLEMQTALTLETHFAPLFEVDLRLPSEWQIVTATKDDQPLSWHSVAGGEAGINQFRVALNSPVAVDGKVQIRLSLRRDVDGWPVESQPIVVNIPELILPQASLTEGALVIRGDDDLDIEATDVKGLDPQPLKADFERLRFQSQDTRYSGKLKITRKPSRVAVQTVTFGRIDPQTFHAFLQAVVEVRGGGIRSIDVALPESIATSIRFVCPVPQIVEQKPAATQNGERIWTLQFDQRLRGQALIVCDLEMPRGEDGQFHVPQMRFVSAERQNGFLAVEAAGEQRLTVVAKGTDGQDLAEVDPLDLPSVYYQPKERIVALLRATTPGATLTLTEQKFDKLPVATAVCPKLQMSTILGRTGELQHKAHFQLHLTGVQGLHVTLPKDSVLWATTMNGSPVEVRRNGDVYLIPIAANVIASSSQTPGMVGPSGSHALQLFYRSKIESVSQFGTLSQSPPTLTVESGKGTALTVEVLEQNWALHYPGETRIVESRSAMEPQQPLDEISLLGSWSSKLTPPPAGDLAQRGFAVVVVLFVLGLIWNAGSQNTKRRLVEALVTLVVIAVLLSLVAPAVQNARRAARTIKLEERSASSEFAKPAAKPVDLNVGKHVVMDDTPIAAQSDATEALPRTEAVPKREVIESRPTDRGPAAPQAPELAQTVPPEQQNAPVDQAKVAGQGAASQSRQSRQALGLLSLDIDFNPPAGSQVKSFRYVGSDSSTGGIPLDVNFVDRQSGAAFRVFVIAVVALIGWLMRNASRLEKIVFAVVGIGLSLGLAPVIPFTFQILLDGILLGTLLVICLWLVVASIRNCEVCNSLRPKISPPVATWLLVATLIGGGSSFAEETKPTPTQANQDRPVLVVEPKTIPTVIIPYELGKDPLASDRIFLSHEQYLELFQAANPDAATKYPDENPGGILEALYSATLVPPAAPNTESIVKVTARFGLRSFIGGQTLIDLPIGHVAVREAKLDGQTANLITEPNRMKVAVQTPGTHVLDLTFEVPARVSGSTGSFSLPLSPVPSGKMTFQLPGRDLAVRVNGSSTIYRRNTQNDVQNIELPIDKSNNVEIAWQPQQAQSAAAAVIHVDSVQAVIVTDVGISVSHGFSLRVRQGGVADTTFSVPDALRLQSISGPDVGGWELQGEGSARTLKILFRRNVSDETRLTIETFLDTKLGSEATLVAVPQIAPKQSSNEIGQIAVFAGNQFSIRADRTESLSQMDGDKFQTQIPISRPNVVPQLAYRFAKRPYVLNLRVTRQPSLAHVTAQQAALVSLRKIQTTTRLRYNLTGAPRSSLSVTLPANFVILDVKATGLRDWYATKQDDGSLLTIELNAPRLDLTEVVVGGFVSRDVDAVSLKFPQPVEPTRLESTAAVWLDQGFTGSLNEFTGWRSVDAAQMSAELKSVRPGVKPQFAFASADLKPGPISLGLKQATPKLSANGLSIVTVNDIGVIYTLALQWQIDAAKSDALTLTTPNWLAGKLEFQADGLREATHVDAGNGRTRWTLHLRTPVSGKYFVTAIGTLPPAISEVLAPAIVFESEQKPLDVQQQYVLLINSSLSQLSSVEPALTEPVQKEDIPVIVAKDFVDSATELVRVKTILTAPRWSLHKFAQQPGVPASVNVADLTTLLSRDGTYRGQAVYTLKNRSRQFLALRMPEGTELISVFVGGQPSRAVAAKLPSMNGGTAQLAALPKTSGASLSFPVKIVWRGRLSGPLPKNARLLSDEISVPAPQVISLQEDPEYGIPVARTRWTVYLPEDLDAEAVRSTAKHNLSLSPAFDQLYAEAAIQDAGDLLGFLSQVIASNRRTQTVNNLKQLGQAYNNLKQLEQTLNQHVSTDAQFNQKRADIQARTAEIASQVQEESQRTNEFLAKSSAEDDAKSPISFQADGINSGVEIGIEQRRALNESNGIVVDPMDGRKSESVADLSSNDAFSYRLSEAVAEEKVLTSSSKQGRPAKGKNAADAKDARQQLNTSNKSNIDELNSVVTSNSLQRASRRSQIIQNQVTNNFDVSTGQILDSNSGQVVGNNSISNTISGNGLWGNDGTIRINGYIDSNSSNSSDQTIPLDSFSVVQNANGSGTLPQLQSDVTLGKHAHFGGPASLKSHTVRNKTPQQNLELRQNVGGRGGEFFGMNPAPQVAQQGRVAVGREAGNAPVASQGAVWNQTGGLSLEMDLPTTGRKLVFTKTGGDPRMTLAVRSRESVRMGLGVVWSVVWIGFTITVLAALRRPLGIARLQRLLPIGILIIGIIGFCVLPAPYNWCGFAAFVIAGLIASWQNRQSAAAI